MSQYAPYQLQRIGLVMEPDPHDPGEAWGVLNPASARKDGELYLFPRVVAEGNFSRIGLARTRFADDGEPMAVTRLGYALEPETEYELFGHGQGGVEDPRVTWVEPLQLWVMAYTAVSHLGPRIAVAVSQDALHWRRLGLLHYDPSCAVNFNEYGNKDGMFFPQAVNDPSGKPALAILHRPTYLVHRPDGTVLLEVPEGIHEERESIWIGYISLEQAKQDIEQLVHVYDNRLVIGPEYGWESLKIGGGTPPILTPQGWLTFYHGVTGVVSLDPNVPKHVVYSAGALLLDERDPTKVLYRSPQPVLAPDEQDERVGIVPNVVFPTAIDAREDGRLDVYYGMADSRIGVATTVLPDKRPEEGGQTCESVF